MEKSQNLLKKNIDKIKQSQNDDVFIYNKFQNNLNKDTKPSTTPIARIEITNSEDDENLKRQIEENENRSTIKRDTTSTGARGGCTKCLII